MPMDRSSTGTMASRPVMIQHSTSHFFHMNLSYINKLDIVRIQHSTSHFSHMNLSYINKLDIVRIQCTLDKTLSNFLIGPFLHTVDPH